MKVKDLILELQKFDPETLVGVSGYEDGYDEVDSVAEILVTHRPKNPHYYGKYTQEDENELKMVVLQEPKGCGRFGWI